MHPKIQSLDLYQTQNCHWHCVVLQSKKDLCLQQLHNISSRLILIWRNESWSTPQHNGLYFLQAPVSIVSLLLIYFVFLMQEEGHRFWGTTELLGLDGLWEFGVGAFLFVLGRGFWGVFLGGGWGAFCVLFLLSHTFVTKNQGFSSSVSETLLYSWCTMSVSKGLNSNLTTRSHLI